MHVYEGAQRFLLNVNAASAATGIWVSQVVECREQQLAVVVTQRSAQSETIESGSNQLPLSWFHLTEVNHNGINQY